MVEVQDRGGRGPRWYKSEVIEARGGIGQML